MGEHLWTASARFCTEQIAFLSPTVSKHTARSYFTITFKAEPNGKLAE